MIEEAVAAILTELGYDLADQHFQRTPERVASMLREFAANGNPNVAKKILDVQFRANLDIDSVVIVGPIRVISMCAHHMSLITGNVWIGYLPDQHVCGLSKLSRIARYLSRQYTIQEVLTNQIIDTLEENLKPRGSMVVMKATHSCMSARGVEEPAAITSTSSIRGIFKESPAARAEFFSLCDGL